MTVRIVSKMANSVSYRTYQMAGDKAAKAGVLPVPDPNPVIIRGGAERPSQRSGFGEQSTDISGNVLWTPRGVVTVLSDEDFARVKEHPLFAKHLKGGYLAVLEGDRDVEHNHKKVTRIVEDMEGQDRSIMLNKHTLAQRIKVKTPGGLDVNE